VSDPSLLPSLRSGSTRCAGTLSDVRLPVTIPEALAVRLRELADRDCSSVAATARRLLARGIEREIALTTEAGSCR
jgi:hypothetical protein